MQTYNQFDPKHYKGSYGVLQISKEEAESYLGFRLKRIDKAESIVLSSENRKAYDINKEKCMTFLKAYEAKRNTARKEFEMMKDLGFRIYAPVDYYLERYFNLKEYKKVYFALSSFSEGKHPVEVIAKEMLQFVRDEGAVEKLEEYLRKERRCQM